MNAQAKPSGFRVEVVEKARGECQQGKRGGWDYESPKSGHKIYVSGPEECQQVASKFLSEEQLEQQKEQGSLPEERARLAQQAASSKEELLAEVSEGVEEVTSEPKKLTQRIWSAMAGGAAALVEGDVSALKDAFESEPGFTAVTPQDVMDSPGWEGSEEEATLVAREFNIRRKMEQTKLPILANDEKRGHIAMAKTFLGAFSMAAGKAAVRAGDKMGGERGEKLKAWGEKEQEASSWNEPSDAEKSYGAGYVLTYAWSLMAAPVFYGTYIGMGAQQLLAPSLGAGSAWAVGTAITTYVGMEVWKRAVKPLTNKLISKVQGEDVDPLAVDVVNGYIRLDELTPEARAEMEKEMVFKSEGSDPKKREVPQGEKHADFYKDMLEDVLPGVFVEVLEEIEEHGFSDKDKDLIERLAHRNVEKQFRS